MYPLALFAMLMAFGCTPEVSAVQNREKADVAPVSTGPESHVLVVKNVASPTAKRIAEYYIQKRGIPISNVIDIEIAPNEEVSLDSYKMHIESPIERFLTVNTLKNRIDYIVLTKGIPLRITGGGYSVDAFLATMEMKFDAIPDTKPASFQKAANPYFNKSEHFSKAKYGFYLVTRLDGYTVEDAMKLVDNSMAAKPSKGTFLFDEDPRRNGAGYDMINDSMKKAAAIVKSKGLDSYLEDTKAFMGRRTNLAGYYSWGSNDYSFDTGAYKAITFAPGAIAETAVSTSGRTMWPTSTGQSLIADLIAGGVTGVKGYVSEPYTIALCPASILFDRYTSGYNLAESFYMATPLLKWKDIVVGDPLCSPYSK
jgi:uncharacterized protein (TIGR03790 family)